MKSRKKISIFDRTCDRIFDWAAGMLIGSLPVIGPIFSVVSLANDVAEIEKEFLGSQ
jgi:hypothetical protein